MSERIPSKEVKFDVQKEEKPFDPHSVPSVDESGTRIPQYETSSGMQKEMDEIQAGTSFETGKEVRDDDLEYVSIIPPAFKGTRSELYETLRKLVKKLTE